jgi:hypothetical protein
VRQNLFTCCRCGAERRTSIEVDDAPVGWATVSYQRVAPSEDDQRTETATLTTHACEDCADKVLAFLERVTGKNIDHAFDDGGAA